MMINLFRKRYLIDYRASKFQSLNDDGVDFTLKIKTLYPFGIKRVRDELMYVDARFDLSKTMAKWDGLIKSGKPIN